MMVPVNVGGTGCGLGGWLEVRRVPATGWLEVCVACRSLLMVATHWVRGRTRACGGEGCPLCSRFALRTYTFVGVNVLDANGRASKAVLELPGGFANVSQALREAAGETGMIVRLWRDGASRRRRIQEEIRGTVKGRVSQPVEEWEIYCSVAGVLGLEVSREQMQARFGRAVTFAAACAAQARKVAEQLGD